MFADALLTDIVS